MKIHLSSVLGAALWLLMAVDAQAEQSDESPFIQHRAQHGFNALFGLPAVAARPVATREWQLSLEHNNQFMGGEAGDEQLLIDGESSELAFRHRQRLGACVQAEAVVALMQHSEGVFDRAIDDWHAIFGLPDAHRGDSPYEQLNYAYSGKDGQGVQVDRPQSGLGDVQLSIQRSLRCQATADATVANPIVRLGIKLPTGDLEELRGSGEIDVYADLQSPVWQPTQRWRTAVAGGAMVVGRSERTKAVLPPQNAVVAYGTLATQFKLTQRFRLLAQLDWHTPFYRSDILELGDVAVSLSGGLRFLGPADQSVELTISEDAAIDTTPDIVARLAWTYRPSGGR